jgi:aerobic carbon-monoxide dehydrogenase medium subunit
MRRTNSMCDGGDGVVKAAAFEYFAPESVDEVVALLQEHGDEGKILAGGQSLMPLMALRLGAPEVLIDINRVGGLDRIENGGSRLRVGALVRHRAVERTPGLERTCAAIADAVPLIGHVAIRNRGTVVGSLAHADPAAEWPALALALDARITAAGPAGTRELDAVDFFESYLSNSLADDEFVTHAEFTLPAGTVGSAFEELARRHGDFALCGVAAVLALTPSGEIGDARVVVCGAGPTPLRIGAAEQALTGQQPSPERFGEAAEAVHAAIDPRGDIHGSAEYRRHVTRVVARRALQLASARAGVALNQAEVNG